MADGSAGEPPFIPLNFERVALGDSLRRAHEFFAEMNCRRTTRHFSREPVPRDLIELAIRTAGTAPSGAHQQPWTFVAVSDAARKAQIRAAAEEEERLNYSGRMPPEWIRAVRPLGTDRHKAHITDAPWVVVAFRRIYDIDPEGNRRTLYYTQESVGIAVGLFIAAVHHMGLATLTHTPSPMGFLAELLGRPAYEKAFLLLPVGYPAADARVPDLHRKTLEEIAVFL